MGECVQSPSTIIERLEIGTGWIEGGAALLIKAYGSLRDSSGNSQDLHFENQAIANSYWDIVPAATENDE